MVEGVKECSRDGGVAVLWDDGSEEGGEGGGARPHAKEIVLHVGEV